MPGKRSFIDSRPKLFIALKQIDMDTFYRHLFIIAERRYPVTLYEQLVIELTNPHQPIVFPSGRLPQRRHAL